MPRRGNKPKEGTDHASAATQARDTDSSVEKDPGAGRSVDRAPHPSEVEGTTRSMLIPGGSTSGRRATNGRDRGSDSDVRRGVPGRAPLRAIGETRWVEDTSGESRAADATRTGRDSLRSEPCSVSHSRVTGDSTRSRRTSRTREGQPARGRTDGAPKHDTHRREADGRRLREVDGKSERAEPAAMDRAARAPPGLRTRAGRGTAGGEQAAVMRYGCRRGANLRRVERQRERKTRPEKLRLRRPIRRKPGEPRPGTGCNMPEVVNGGNRRGGEKPRGRSETDGVATVGRRRIAVLREWTFTGPSGDGASARDEVPGEEGSCTTRSALWLASQRIQLGSARTPKVRPRWEAA